MKCSVLSPARVHVPRIVYSEGLVLPRLTVSNSVVPPSNPDSIFPMEQP